MKSELRQLGNVIFPSFTGERVYMRPVRKGEKLPSDLSRWQATVDAMLESVDVSGYIYLTVDQGVMEPGDTQRRAGPHIDGNWVIDGYSTGHRVMAWDTGGGKWNTKNLEAGGIILACDRDGAKAYKGEFSGVVGDGGDCSHLDLSGAEVETLVSNKAYIGSVNMVHEAMPAQECGERTFVRLTLPEDFAFAA